MIGLALLAAATALPRPAELKTFQDWAVGCDNGRACHAVALIPENWPDDALTMSVRRGPGAADAPVLAFDLGSDSNAASLSADGKRLAARLVGREGYTQIAAADAPRMIGVLRSAGRLEVLAADGKRLGTVSLNGASAALLYMDEQQRRTGTSTALVRPGNRAPGSLFSPPPLPVVVARPISSDRPLAVSAAALRALRKKHGCTIDEVGGPEEGETAAIGRSETLLLLACGSGAYNVSYVPFVLRRGHGGAELADFDIRPGWWAQEGKPMLINAGWDKERGLLTSFSKGRGLGDCGTSAEYAWDGRAFRLVGQAEMDECRGSRDYITTWRARLVRK
ncbi:MAG TPA: DUF1176 domain-containing protein [Allosphingosinicella sp.]|nr:DUF1176 domain-containing protein [Allosphingosinicella sp.]